MSLILGCINGECVIGYDFGVTLIACPVEYGAGESLQLEGGGLLYYDPRFTTALLIHLLRIRDLIFCDAWAAGCASSGPVLHAVFLTPTMICHL